MILMVVSKTAMGQINYASMEASMASGGRPITNNGDENTIFEYALDVENINQKNGGSYAPPATPTANTCWTCKERFTVDNSEIMKGFVDHSLGFFTKQVKSERWVKLFEGCRKLR